MKNIILVIVFVGIFIGGYYWYSRVVPESENQSTDNEQEPVVEMGATVTTTIGDMEFIYPSAPDGYIVVEDQATGLANLLESVTLYNESEYKEAQEREAPSEYPPAINIMVFANDEDLSAQAWAEANSRASNIELITGEVTTVTQGGVEGIRYTTDGLYTNDVYVFVYNGQAYLLIGAYFESGSPIHQDFGDLIRSLSFN